MNGATNILNLKDLNIKSRSVDEMIQPLIEQVIILNKNDLKAPSLH